MTPDLLRGELRGAEPMARHTSWRVGGPADRFYRPADLDDLVEFLSSLAPDEPVFWLGLGSNLLVRDGGLEGTVISTQSALTGITRCEGGLVEVESGVSCAKLARRCSRWGLAEADFFAGIPGTTGGALAMNAGAFGGETWRHVVAIRVVNRSGVMRWREPREYRVGYRTVISPQKDEWFVAARFEFPVARPDETSEIKTLLAKRSATQPLGVPSCGSVFRNPAGDHAARLIEACGLKGLRIGGAEVSAKHANFIVNLGGATAADIEALIRRIQNTVRSQFDIDLEPEVRIVGRSE